MLAGWSHIVGVESWPSSPILYQQKLVPEHHPPSLVVEEFILGSHVSEALPCGAEKEIKKKNQ